MIAGGNAQEMSAAQQEIAIDMLMKKGFLFSTDTESRKISG
jgi:hypothetical protein